MIAMKRFINIAVFFLTGGLLLSGCYDDKGSYDYHDVNEVVIDLPTTVSVRLDKKEAVSVKIEPKLSQTLEEGEAQLTYLWEREKKNSLGLNEWTPCGEEKVCELSFNPEDVNPLAIRLRVQDHREDGSEWYKQLTVQPIVPYGRSWFVLQYNEGKCVLGAVDGEGSGGVVIPDAYKLDMGKDLPIGGTPKYLLTDWMYGSPQGSIINAQQPVIFVGTDQDVYLMNAVSFKQVWKYRDMLHIKEVLHDENFVPEWLATQTYSTVLGEILSDNGKLYMANADGYSVYYPLVWENDADASEFKITKVAPLQGIGFILYDEQNHRFLKTGIYDDFMEGYYYNQYYRKYGMEDYFYPNKTVKKLAKIGENPRVENVFDPDNIGDDKKMINMNMYYADGKYGVLATCFSTSDRKIHVYDLNAAGFGEEAKEAICAAKHTFDLPGGMSVDEVSVTACYLYGKTVFFAGGNKIYKVDFNRTIPKISLLYEHKDPNVRITGLKFKNSLYDTGYSADPNDYESEWMWNYFPYYLGASLDYGGNEGGILEMKLTTAAEVDPDSEIVEHKGFGKIVDFGYSAKV